MAPPQHYRIEVQGRLPSGVAEELPTMVVDRCGERTTLSGALADTAALYGLIARLEALGLVLLSVQPTIPSRHAQEDPDVDQAQ